MIPALLSDLPVYKATYNLLLAVFLFIMNFSRENRFFLVSGKFVFLTRILQATKIGNFECLPAQRFGRWQP
jgi:hypothetical protein